MSTFLRKTYFYTRKVYWKVKYSSHHRIDFFLVPFTAKKQQHTKRFNYDLFYKLHFVFLTCGPPSLHLKQCLFLLHLDKVNKSSQPKGAHLPRAACTAASPVMCISVLGQFDGVLGIPPPPHVVFSEWRNISLPLPLRRVIFPSPPMSPPMSAFSSRHCMRDLDQVTCQPMTQAQVTLSIVYVIRSGWICLWSHSSCLTFRVCE